MPHNNSLIPLSVVIYFVVCECIPVLCIFAVCECISVLCIFTVCECISVLCIFTVSECIPVLCIFTVSECIPVLCIFTVCECISVLCTCGEDLSTVAGLAEFMITQLDVILSATCTVQATYLLTINKVRYADIVIGSKKVVTTK